MTGAQAEKGDRYWNGDGIPASGTILTRRELDPAALRSFGGIMHSGGILKAFSVGSLPFFFSPRVWLC
jgi:hypothetical protein